MSVFLLTFPPKINLLLPHKMHLSSSSTKYSIFGLFYFPLFLNSEVLYAFKFDDLQKKNSLFFGAVSVLSSSCVFQRCINLRNVKQ